MIDWSSYTAEEIKAGTHESGARLVLLFCQDYKKAFGQGADCCHNCPSFPQKVTKYLNRIKEMDTVENSGFVLKLKYNGIQLGVGQDPISNKTLTDAKAIELISKHPAGENLFDKIPENWEEIAEELEGAGSESFEDQVSGMLKPALIDLANELGLDDSGTVKQLKARIIENGSEKKEAAAE